MRRALARLTRLSIRAQAFGVVLAIAIPLAGIIVAQGLFDASHDLEISSAASHALADGVARGIGQNIELAQARLEVIAERPLVAAVDGTRCDPELPGLLAVMPEFANLAIINPRGDVICSVVAQPGGVPASVADTEWFVRTIQSRAFIVGKPFIGPITGRWVSVQSLPILGADGAVRGVVALPIDLAHYAELLTDVAFPDGSAMTVFDADGTIVARSTDAEAWVGRNGRGTEVVDTAVLRHEGVAVATGPDGVERTYGFAAIPAAGWYASVGVPTRAILEPIYTRLAVILGASLLIVVLLLWLARRLTERTVHPMRMLAATASAVAGGQTTARAPESGPPEVVETARALNSMLDVNARLVEDLSLHVDALERSNGQLEAITAVTELAPLNLPLDNLLNQLLKRVRKAVSSDSATILLLEPETGDLVVRATLGVGQRSASPIRVPLGQGFAGRIAAEGRPIIVEDAEAFAFVGTTLPRRLRSLAGVPLRVGDRTIGVLHVGTRVFRTFGNEDIQLLMLVAERTASAIDRVRQADALAKQADELEVRVATRTAELSEINAALKAVGATTRQELQHQIQERSNVAASLARITVQETPEETADLICAEIRETLGLDLAGIDWFLSDATIILAIATQGVAPFGPGKLIPAVRAAYLRERASRGPWIEVRTDEDLKDPYLRSWYDAGFDVGAFVPLVSRGRTHGFLVAASGSVVSIEEMSRRLPALIEYAALTSAILEPALSSRTTASSEVSAVRAVIAAGAYQPVFQPIVDLSSGLVAGYEALTRFSDGISPAIHFANARAAGVGVELEYATLAAAVEAGHALPPSAFATFNVSAELLFTVLDLASLLAGVGRSIVLELTEHEAGIQAPRLLERVTSLGGDIRLAVDDTGAGYAGLQRVLELRPQFVKLDIALVRNIDHDPAREALIAGMVHFARETDAALIAEGVEREGERRMLRRLGVTFGQGYLLGRPGPAETWTTTSSEAT